MSLTLFDWQCSDCGTVEERLEERSVEHVPCPECAGIMTKVFSFRGGNHGEEAAWIKSVLDVVDKSSRQRETVEFLQSPTRSNMKAWMKANKLRHLEDGERADKPRIDPRQHAAAIMKLRQDRRRIEIGR